MKEETRKQRATEEKKQAERFKLGQAQRKANEEYARAHGHWDWSPTKKLVQ